MAYVDAGGQTDRKTAIIGVATIHAGLGALLVFGLAGGVFAIQDDTRFVIKEFKDPPTQPPEPDTKPDEPTTQVINREVFIEDPLIELTSDRSPFDPSDQPQLPSDPIDTGLTAPVGAGTGAGAGTAPIGPPLVDPIAAKPSNNPGRWVTNRDYRSSWIRRELTGVARFQLSISASGNVQDCRLLSSTGHAPLDDATCKLVSRRAKFEAARDSSGNKVADVFTTSIRWELPD